MTLLFHFLRELLKLGILSWILLVVPAFTTSAFAIEREPISCLWTNPKGKVVELSCTPYSVPFADLKNDMNGVCLFYKGLWQRVNLRYTQGAMAVKPVTSCDRGVTVASNPEDFDVIGPTVFECQKTNSKIFDSTSCNYKQSKKPLSFKEDYANTDERVINCLLNAKGQRVHGNTTLCNTDPQESGYCDFVNLNTPSFKGNWWVRYNGKNQTRMQVCKGGVTIGKISTYMLEGEASNYNTNFVKLIPKATLNSISSSSSSAYALNTGESVSSCYIHKFGANDFNPKNMQRIQCSSEKCGADEKCSEEGFYSKKLLTEQNTSFAAEKGECFRHSDGKWYIIMKHIKGNAFLTSNDFNEGSKRVRRCFQIEVLATKDVNMSQ